MKYIIKINYNTGDSFHNEEGVEGHLDMNWENLDIVKENLKRIAEHYKAYQEINGYSRRNKTWKDYKNMRWYIEHYPEFTVKLLLDDNTEYNQSTTMWTGYFETLNYIEIESDNSDLKINFR